ncbi:putative transcription factor WD40-like family [Lupinus albus]|uniref:Putative transcription factor WD40-like family n=1 Tax=Lupinus albus TaxID=3870 RepID=A0A6A4QLZ1_LUPAL|nr:putative transcription factor WD40-like family [Lupinus albus]
MFSRFFQKSPSKQQRQQQNVVHSSFSSADFNPRVLLHYGVPPNASILAFDRIQRLLAVGTLDGRIKVFGGDNIEGILFSPKHTSFKNLEFLENQGFLASVSSDNEIQVWDLESRQIASALKWESAITAFSVIYGTSYIYVGSEHGMVYVLKFDSEDRKIEILPYYVPTDVISEAVGMSLDHVSVVKVLHQPCSNGNRLLIAYENGVMVLWDASEDRIVLIRGYKDTELKRKNVASFPNDTKDELPDDQLDHEEEDKEICSVSWASSDGSVVVVGYVDGDIMFWDLSTADSPSGQAQKVSKIVIKLQLSSADRRLPVIVLHWCAAESLNNSGGQLFVYGGDEIGSEEVLTVVSLDWSSGIENLKCTGRIDVMLSGSFADMILLSSDFHTEGACNMLFVLSNPGQLDLYDKDCLSSLMSHQEKKTSAPAMQYPMAIPTLEPYMTTARLGVVYQDVKSFRALSEILVAAKQHSVQSQTSMGIKWPLTGGVPGQILKEYHHIIQIYIAGYRDGSIRIWDATYPALSLVYNIKSEVSDIKVGIASAPVSALDFCPDTLHLAVGYESGVVCLYGLIRSSADTTLHYVTKNGTEGLKKHQGDGPHCTAVFSVQSSAVFTLQFASLGEKLVVGYEHGQVALLDISSSSVLFLTNTESNPSSALVSLNAKFSDICSLNILQESVSDISDSSGKGPVFIMTRDANLVVIDNAKGDVVCSRTMNPKVKSNAISMHIIDGTSELSTEKLSSNSPQKNDSGIQANIPSENAQVETSTPLENSYLGLIALNSLILLCYETELSLHSLKFVIEGSSKYIRKVNLVQRCCWTTTFKKDENEYALVVLYQTGDIELRSLPTLEVLGEISLMSILRWSMRSQMEKTICSSSNGQIILVNGNETAVLSLLTRENEFWIPEFFPCLHDNVLAAAIDVTTTLSPDQNEKQGAPGIFINFVKNFKAGKADKNAIQAVHANNLENLERIFSYPPFLKPSLDTVDMQDAFELDIDEIHIDEPLVVSYPQKSDIDKRDKGKGTDREKLLEGGSTDSKPRARTAEEIKAKYKKTGDASAAAALAKDKLVERQEKLQMLSQRTEELQSGAQDFASMAAELAKRMENRKWWQL